jgi:acetyltransferase-like isoleucine patch superfamily enzyme
LHDVPISIPGTEGLDAISASLGRRWSPSVNRPATARERGSSLRSIQMRETEPGGAGSPVRSVAHLQFHQPRWIRLTMKLLGIACWPVTWPLAMLSRTSDEVFRTISEMLSLIPYLVGIIVRREFYRFSFESCGENLVVGFGAVFLHRGIRIGNNVLVGRYSIVHYCDIGDYSMTAEHAVLNHGAHYHNLDRTDIPMALQGGVIEPIAIAEDCIVHSNATVMASVARGSIVGAGAVVTRPVEEYSIVVGNPARLLRKRGVTSE